LNCLLSNFIETMRSSILAIGHLLTLVVVYKITNTLTSMSSNSASHGWLYRH